MPNKIGQTWGLDLMLSLFLFLYSAFLLVAQPPDAIRFPSLPLYGCWLVFFAIQLVYYVWSGGPMGAALSQPAIRRSLIPFFIAAAFSYGQSVRRGIGVGVVAPEHILTQLRAHNLHGVLGEIPAAGVAIRPFMFKPVELHKALTIFVDIYILNVH